MGNECSIARMRSQVQVRFFKSQELEPPAQKSLLSVYPEEADLWGKMKGGPCVYFGCAEDGGAGKGGGGRSYHKAAASQGVRTSKRKLMARCTRS